MIAGDKHSSLFRLNFHRKREEHHKMYSSLIVFSTLEQAYTIKLFTVVIIVLSWLARVFTRLHSYVNTPALLGND